MQYLKNLECSFQVLHFHRSTFSYLSKNQ